MAGSRAQITYGGVTYQLDFARQAVWNEALEERRSHLRQTYVGRQDFRALFTPTGKPLGGTLELLLSGSERQVWQDTFMDEFAAGTPVLVWQDRAKVLEFKEYLLTEPSVTVQYNRLTPGSDLWFTLRLPVEVVP